MPRAAESSRAGSNHGSINTVDGSSELHARPKRPGAGAEQVDISRAAGGGRLVPGLFQSQSPLTVALRRLPVPLTPL